MAYFYFDFKNAAMIVSDKMSRVSMAGHASSGGEVRSMIGVDWRSLQIPGKPGIT
jgi:hypothetical protein